MHADTTTVTIQSNKIVSNVVKVNLALLEPSCGKKHNELFGQSSIVHPDLVCMFVQSPGLGQVQPALAPRGERACALSGSDKAVCSRKLLFLTDL